MTADTDDSESSSKNNSNHSSDQHGAAADMQSQFDQVSQQQQLQHKVGISLWLHPSYYLSCMAASLLIKNAMYSSISCSLSWSHVASYPTKATTSKMLMQLASTCSPIGRRRHNSMAFMVLLLPRSPIPTWIDESFGP